ncbi:Aromatic amino acid beta-eliminating lyase/threonine aldolase [Penicillium brevicompactum]|uniref:Aromatic amino acid beta-eliminating lyase/threonine aldolase n=1 Tax=Penicillium brevicompactum TaxID=5074 RepID=UPI002541B0FE|nr:Aromatic amino acid beta-eliminating lyase/threonine aldolase [Penicillium brevicompactum]KAJ5321907.1 Aromatic amino acid beta-eliminating lyase/threonine aldolase [Penicillium brevicompactum]
MAQLSTNGMAHASAAVGNGDKKASTWQGAGAAEFDLRSDTMTKPTASMLEAICQTTLLDDVFNEDPVTNELQRYVAEITKHESSLLVLSGTMGNQVAIRSHLAQPPHAVLCDYRSHIICYEAGGVSAWTGATMQTVVPKNGSYLTLEDIQKNAVLDDDIHSCPTKLISLENTLNGEIMPLSEAKRIVYWAHSQDIKVHLDGARLWEAVVAGAGSLPEYASLFDSVSLCFSKGLGAPIGSIIVGSQALIKKARWFRKSIGGGARQTGVIAAAAQVALNETFGTDPFGKTGKLAVSHVNAKRVAELWTSRGGKLAKPAETNMVWLDLEASGVGPNDLSVIGQEKGLKLGGGRIVIHYQVSDEAIARLEQVFDIALRGDYERSQDTRKQYGSK